MVEDKEVKENRHRPTQLAGMVSIYLTAALVCCTCECRNGYASIHMLVLRRAAWAEKYIHICMCKDNKASQQETVGILSLLLRSVPRSVKLHIVINGMHLISTFKEMSGCLKIRLD